MRPEAFPHRSHIKFAEAFPKESPSLDPAGAANPLETTCSRAVWRARPDVRACVFAMFPKCLPRACSEMPRTTFLEIALQNSLWRVVSAGFAAGGILSRPPSLETVLAIFPSNHFGTHLGGYA